MMDELLATLQQEKIVVRIDADIQDLIPSFLANRQQDIVKIRGALSAGDFTSIQFIAHGLKGSGAGYGFDFITQLGLRLEEAAKNKQETQIKQMTDLLQIYLHKVELRYC